MKWYITWNRPKMKAYGGACWPIMAIRQHKDVAKTIRHEECHLKGQLSLGLLPWFLIYLYLLIRNGYYMNPMEQFARKVADGKDKWSFLGWIKYCS